jgi:hypothetical protein
MDIYREVSIILGSIGGKIGLKMDEYMKQTIALLSTIMQGRSTELNSNLAKLVCSTRKNGVMCSRKTCAQTWISYLLDTNYALFEVWLSLFLTKSY